MLFVLVYKLKKCIFASCLFLRLHPYLKFEINQEINQVLHDKKYILFFHHPINFWVYPCTGKRTKYEYSLWEVSVGDQLSIKLNSYLSAKVESVKDVISEKWEILEKILSFFFQPFYFRFLTFSICICDWFVYVVLLY